MIATVVWLLLNITYSHVVTARVYETEQQCLWQRAQPNARQYSDRICLPVVLEKTDGT